MTDPKILDLDTEFNIFGNVVKFKASVDKIPGEEKHVAQGTTSFALNRDVPYAHNVIKDQTKYGYNTLGFSNLDEVVSGIYKIGEVLVIVHDINHAELTNQFKEYFPDISLYVKHRGCAITRDVVNNITIVTGLFGTYLDNAIEIIKTITGYEIHDLTVNDVISLNAIESYLDENTLYGRVFKGEFNKPVKEIVAKPVNLNITGLIKDLIGKGYPEDCIVSMDYIHEKEIFVYNCSTSLELLRNYHSNKVLNLVTLCKVLQVEISTVKIMNHWRTQVRIEREEKEI